MTSRLTVQCAHGAVDVNVPSNVSLALVMTELCDLCPVGADHLTDMLWSLTGQRIDVERSASELGILDGDILLLDRPRANRPIATPMRRTPAPKQTWLHKLLRR